MASFRILNQAPQFLLQSGQVNAGGKLYTYETDLTTPKLTWSDPDMLIPNTNPILMDAAGRTVTDVWGDGEYGIVMTDADDVTQWTRNNVQASGDPGFSIPALETGKFLSNNGSNLLWSDIVQVPDPTGHADDILYSDGTVAYWAPPPVVPDPPEPLIEVTATSVSWDDGGLTPHKMLSQYGTGSAVTSGGRVATASVTFATPFLSTPVWVDVVVTAAALSAFGNMPSHSITAKSTTGFTVQFTMGELDDSRSGYDFNANVPFMYKADGILL